VIPKSMTLPGWFRPKLVESLVGYERRDFLRDLGAGITVGVVALPLAMAFAIASGAKPEAGVFTAIIAGFLISALGGSRVSIGGPTGAFIVILYSIQAQYGAANLAICTVMAGFILLTMGFARMGTMIKYIPYPVTMGFTSGIAVLIFTTQIKDFFGLRMGEVPSEFLEKIAALAAHVAHPLAVAVFGSLEGRLATQGSTSAVGQLDHVTRLDEDLGEEVLGGAALRVVLDAPKANVELFRRYEADIKKYAMGGLELLGM